MIKTMIVLTALSCPTVKIHNSSGLEFNTHDLNVMESAKKRCTQLYEGQLPCLVIFFKKAERKYSAICGAEKRFTSEKK